MPFTAEGASEGAGLSRIPLEQWLMRRRPDFDWQLATPPEFLPAVTHLRQQYQANTENIDRVTQCLCYGALHPDQHFEDRRDYELVFADMKPTVGWVGVKQFCDLYERKTAPAFFAAFRSIRKNLLAIEVKRFFDQMLCISSPQAHLLPLPLVPANWAGRHVQSLIDEQALTTPNWLKQVCDVNPAKPTDEDEDECFLWRKWRAPSFLMMKPSRWMPFEAHRTWERQGEEETAHWIDVLTEELIIALDAVAINRIGEAHYEELRNPSPEHPVSIAANSRERRKPFLPVQTLPSSPSFSHSADYRSVQYVGQNYALTRKQAIVVKMLHEAHLKGRHWVSDDLLLGACEGSDMRSVFKNSKVWKTLVVREAGRAGMYRLNLGDG